MKSISAKDFARLLERHGWQLIRITGSHHIYCKRGLMYRISLPIHGNAALKIGMLRHFMKLAGLSEHQL